MRSIMHDALYKYTTTTTTTIEWWHFQWPWRTLTGFQGHGVFEFEYLKNFKSIRDKVTIEH